MGYELTKTVAPRWLDMPDGVRIEVRPYDSMIEAQAEAWAARHVRDLLAGGDAAEFLGIVLGDGAVDPQNLHKLLRDVGVAIHAIKAWEGVTVDGEAAPLEPQAVWRWMLDPVNRQTFLAIYDTAYREARSEGNA